MNMRVDIRMAQRAFTGPAEPAERAGFDRAFLEWLIREDYARAHPGETLDDVKRRASFSKEDKGLLRQWMAVAEERMRELARVAAE